jgi:hypothetical protein
MINKFFILILFLTSCFHSQKGNFKYFLFVNLDNRSNLQCLEDFITPNNIIKNNMGRVDMINSSFISIRSEYNESTMYFFFKNKRDCKNTILKLKGE